ncbi:hypothetical protein I4U23_004502 [Adineta vaga]|nr:hypothetical protein I4U23_004502 [Adineta vaga]
MTKGSITVDSYDNGTYIMFIKWTPRPEQYGIHQLCFTPVDSIGQNGQQVCYTFQVDVAAPQFINGSMTPKGLVSRNQALWSISTERNIVPPTKTVAYIRYFKRVNNGRDQEVLRVNAAKDVIYQTRQLFINTSNTVWEDGAHYYILFDSGVISINQSCGIESSPIIDKNFCEFWIAPVSITTHIFTAIDRVTTTYSSTVSSSTTTTTIGNLSSERCPYWLPFGTILKLTTSTFQPNYTFCFTVNTSFADVTIAANTWAPCSTWKISGTADPLLELFTPETSMNSPVAQNDDGNSVDHLNCFAAVLSYRLMKGNHRVVIRHQRCAYAKFELRLTSEANNGIK